MSGFDVLISGAKVIDGTGNPWFYGDVALRGDQVARVRPPGSIVPSEVNEVIDAKGMVICPGFIDIMSHSIVPLMIDNRCLSKITQGVTTEIMGEGATPAPHGGKVEKPKNILLAEKAPEWLERIHTWERFGDWLEAMVEHGVSPNIGSFLGGSTVRSYAKGMTMGPPSGEELTTMRQVVVEAMEDGAFGLSTALIYPPGAYCTTDELVELCKVVSEYNGIYISHMRSEADNLIEGLEEALEIGRRANIPVEIYHLKASGRRNWDKMHKIIIMINKARAEGIDVTADMYPYTAGGTGLTSVLPPWAAADGKLYENISDLEKRAKIKLEVMNPSSDWEAMVDLIGPEGIMPIGFEKPENKQYTGKRLSEIAEMREQDWIDAVFDLLESEEQRISTIYFLINEENVKLQLQQPWITISTDAGGVNPAWAKERGPLHPRAYGTYPRVLGKYVREEGVITLEDAVRKMSSAVASRLGLRERGLLREGFYADIVIFDPSTINDLATFDDPHQLSVGISDVWVNGIRVLDKGVHTGSKPGRIMYGPGRIEP
jgi:N-acyl-D-aspartate/D-glutamate deacylase